MSQVVSQVKVDEASRLAALRRENQLLRSRNAGLTRSLGSIKEFVSEVRGELPILDEPSPIRVAVPAVHVGKPEVVTSLWECDWHTGEGVEKSAVDGWNAFNYKVLCGRIENLGETFLRHMEVKRKAYAINTLYVTNLADMVEGFRTPESWKYAEFEPPEQIVRAADLWVHHVNMLAPHFDEVIINQIVQCNHGRMGEKVGWKWASKSNLDWAVAEFSKRMLSKHTNVIYHIHETVRPLITVGPKRFLVEHGHSVKAWGPYPQYGIERQTMREGFRRMGIAERAFDYFVMGHIHTATSIMDGRARSVGSPVGVSEFVNGRMPSPSTPSQSSWLVGKHGLFDVTDYNLEEGRRIRRAHPGGSRLQHERIGFARTANV